MADYRNVKLTRPPRSRSGDFRVDKVRTERLGLGKPATIDVPNDNCFFLFGL